MIHTVIKLGGSILTDKTKPCTLRTQNLINFAHIFNQYQATPDEKIWLFHGAGSFAHFSAKRWQETGNEQYFYQAQSEVSQLNNILQEHLKAPYFFKSARDFWSDRDKFWRAQALEKEIYLGFGDAVEVSKKKIIVSADQQIQSLLKFLQTNHFEPYNEHKKNASLSAKRQEPETTSSVKIRTLFVGDTAGVLDEAGQTISTLSSDNLPPFFSQGQTDVTGGMAGKLQAVLPLVSPQCTIELCSGERAENLANWLEGKNITSTKLANTKELTAKQINESEESYGVQQTDKLTSEEVQYQHKADQRNQ